MGWIAIGLLVGGTVLLAGVVALLVLAVRSPAGGQAAGVSSLVASVRPAVYDRARPLAVSVKNTNEASVRSNSAMA